MWGETCRCCRRHPRRKSRRICRSDQSPLSLIFDDFVSKFSIPLSVRSDWQAARLRSDLASDAKILENDSEINGQEILAFVSLSTLFSLVDIHLNSRIQNGTQLHQHWALLKHMGERREIWNGWRSTMRGEGECCYLPLCIPPNICDGCERRRRFRVGKIPVLTL